MDDSDEIRNLKNQLGDCEERIRNQTARHNDDLAAIEQLEGRDRVQEQAIEALKKHLAQEQQAHHNTNAHIAALNDTISEKEAKIQKAADDNSKVEKALAEQKAKFSDAQHNLNLVYADLTESIEIRKNVAKARDEAQVLHLDLSEKLDSLHKQWEEAEDKIDQLQGQLQSVADVEKENAGLMDDVDNLRAHIANHDRTLTVKDQRISYLEAQFQKERERNQRAADEANAANAAAQLTPASPTDAPPQIPIAIGESLEDELNAAHDSDESEYDVSSITSEYTPAPATPLTMHIREAANTAPIAPVERQISTTTVATQTDAASLALNIPSSAVHEITPIERQITATTVASTQTDTANLTLNTPSAAVHEISPIERQTTATTVASTQTDTASLMLHIPSTAVYEIEPVAPLEIVSQTVLKPIEFSASMPCTPTLVSARRTPGILSNSVSALGSYFAPIFKTTPPVVENTSPQQTTSLKQVPTPKQATISVLKTTLPKRTDFIIKYLPFITALLLCYCIWLCFELHSWKTANGVAWGQNYNTYDRGGAYGNGRYIFGIIPVAMDVGNSWISELLARHMSTALTHFEDWAGINTTPLY